MNTHLKRRRAALWRIALAVGLMAPAQVLAEESASDAVALAKIDTKVETILGDVAKYYRGLESLRVDIMFDLDFEAADVKQSLHSKHAVAMQRPNKLAAKLLSDGPGMSLYSNDKGIMMFVPVQNVYLEDAAVANFDAPPGAKMMHLSDLGLMFLESLLSNDPKAALLEDTTGATYGGTEEVEGKKCHKITIESPDIGWTLWVDSGKSPLVRQLEPIVPDLLESLSQGMPSSHEPKVRVLARFSNWQPGAEVNAADFEFTPPSGATKFDPTAAPQAPSAASVKGKSAPALTLRRLGGGEVELGEQYGRQVVVVDFWATWCAPCRASLPTMAKVAKEFASKGVVFYAVNFLEDPGLVEQYIRDNKLDMTVLMDSDGGAATRFGAVALPTTFIIGRDGIVRHVHEGIPGGDLVAFERQLRDELNALTTAAASEK